MAQKRLKIAFLNISQTRVERGAETFVLEVSSRLKKAGHKMMIISGEQVPPPRWPILWRTHLDPFGLTICFFTLKNLGKIIKAKPDIVLPLNGGWQSWLIRLATWLCGAKMVISGQSGKGWDDRTNLWSFPDVFVALSTRLQKWAHKWNPLIRVEHIPNGVDTQKFTPKGKARDFGLKRPVILCAGALTDEKRIELAIRAVAQLDQASLAVVGEGPLKEKLNSLGLKLLGDNFFLGRADFQNMPEIYRGADLFTLPSPWYRAFEIVLVEAMATNLPVVATDDPIRREIVGSAGIFVDPTDTQAYAQALKKALKTNWGAKPRQQVEKFDWDKIAQKYEELFLELCQK